MIIKKRKLKVNKLKESNKLLKESNKLKENDGIQNTCTCDKHVNPTYDKPQLAYYDITEMKQVYLTCTCGGTIREPGKIHMRTDKDDKYGCLFPSGCYYIYTCPDCGKKYMSETPYPYSVSIFNNVAEKVEEAANVKECTEDSENDSNKKESNK